MASSLHPPVGLALRSTDKIASNKAKNGGKAAGFLPIALKYGGNMRSWRRSAKGTVSAFHAAFMKICCVFQHAVGLAQPIGDQLNAAVSKSLTVISRHIVSLDHRHRHGKCGKAPLHAGTNSQKSAGLVTFQTQSNGKATNQRAGPAAITPDSLIARPRPGPEIGKHAMDVCHVPALIAAHGHNSASIDRKQTVETKRRPFMSNPDNHIPAPDHWRFAPRT